MYMYMYITDCTNVQVFLGGPPLVKMATGEVVDDESLGGADMHSRISGVSDFLASNEYDGILKARQIVANLHWQKKATLPNMHFSEHIDEPLYDPGVSLFLSYITCVFVAESHLNCCCVI